jgi:hypothetical protein
LAGVKWVEVDKKQEVSITAAHRKSLQIIADVEQNWSKKKGSKMWHNRKSHRL